MARAMAARRMLKGECEDKSVDDALKVWAEGKLLKAFTATSSIDIAQDEDNSNELVTARSAPNHDQDSNNF